MGTVYYENRSVQQMAKPVLLLFEYLHKIFKIVDLINKNQLCRPTPPAGIMLAYPLTPLGPHRPTPLSPTTWIL